MSCEDSYSSSSSAYLHSEHMSVVQRNYNLGQSFPPTLPPGDKRSSIPPTIQLVGVGIDVALRSTIAFRILFSGHGGGGPRLQQRTQGKTKR